MRKFLAGRLILLAHRIYPPQVTEFKSSGMWASGTVKDLRTGRIIVGAGGGGGGGGTVFGDYPPGRCETRGWN